MELHEGLMSIKDLSVWFGLKPDTLSASHKKAKEKKFEILKTFANYHFEGKKVYIDKVIHPTYTKAFEIIEEEMPKRWGKVKDDSGKYIKELQEQRIDTSARVGKDIWYNVPEVQSQISIRTSQVYTNKVKAQKYGKAYLDNSHGTCGRSEYVWMNRDGNAPLDEESLKKLNECAVEAYKDISVKIAQIDDEYHQGNISKEERDKSVGEVECENNYSAFVTLVIEALGFYPDKRTRIIDEEIFND